MKTASEIFAKMKDEMPFEISDSVKPYVEEAMRIYAEHAIREAAERAVTKFVSCGWDCDDDEVSECRDCGFLVDKQSILNLINELK